MKRLILLLLISILSYCGVSQKEYDDLKNISEDQRKRIVKMESDNKKIITESKKIIAENKSLKKEIEDLKFGAERLLNNAIKYSNDNNKLKAISLLELLIKKHPVSDEARKGKLILAAIRKESELENKKRLAGATKKLKKNRDEINKITWYSDRYSSNSLNSLIRVALYFGRYDSGLLVGPKMDITYYGNNWLFIEDYTVQIDDKNHTIIPPKQPKRTVAGLYVWEISDILIDTHIKEIIKNLLKCKNATIHYNGSEGIHEHRISKQEIKGMKEVLEGYKALGGKF